MMLTSGSTGYLCSQSHTVFDEDAMQVVSVVNNSITFIGLDTHKDFFEVAYLEDNREAKPVCKDAEISRRSLLQAIAWQP